MKLTAWERFPYPVRKAWRVMRITTLLILIFCLHLSAKTMAQKITLSSNNISIEQFFNQLEKQTGYSFLLENGVLSKDEKISINVKDASLETVLDQILKPISLSYKIENKTVYVQKAKVEKLDQMIALTPPGEIHGTITSVQGVPLGGATVVIKRTKIGVETNAKGEFTLEGVNPDDQLIISFVGYKTQTIKVGGGKGFPIVLQVATDELDKVVVQAYGTTSQRLTTGNIGTVSAAQIERQPVMNVLTALQGQVPGLVITQVNGYASAPFKVEIRGRSGIDPNRPSEPLYIIDGVPLTILENGTGNYATGSLGITQNGFAGPVGGQSPLFSINPSDIESVSVLKDADATAIYGSRGANGVILITTKKGKPGKTLLDVVANHGVEEVTQHYSMLNTQQYLEMRREAFKNDGITPDAGNAYDLVTWDTTRYTDWQKFQWGKMGQTTDIQMALSGGDRQTSFRLGGGYHRETDITTAKGANQRASVQFNLTHKSLDQRLSISFTSTYSYVTVDAISLPGSPTMIPNSPAPFNANGSMNWTGWYPSSNPFGSLLQPYSSNTDFLNSAATISYQIIKGLTLSTKLGYSTSHNSQLMLLPISSVDPASNPTGGAQFGNNNNANAIVEPQLEYNNIFGKGKFNALLGGSSQVSNQNGNAILGTGYLNDNLLRSIDNAPSTSASDNNSEYRYAAIFARITYNWADKYIVNLSARRDGSSRFGPGKQYGNFGAIGAAWIFSEEPWFKNTFPSISFGKLRGSYGITGNDGIGDYDFLSQWASGSTSTYVSGSPAYSTVGLFNPDLEWEVNKKLEGAFDLGLFKDRLNMEVAYYRNLCGNQLVSTAQPYTTGFGFVGQNLPATIQNTGLEATFKAKLVDQKNFEWSINFNIGTNRNKLLSFPTLAQSSYRYLYVVGKPLGLARLLHYTGIDPQTGQYTFQDKNHDGVINTNTNDTANDLYLTDLTIRFEGGFGTDLRYKNFQLSMFFRFRQLTEPGNIQSIGTPGGMTNFPTEVLNRWQKPGDKAEFARFTTQPQVSDANFYYNSDGVYSNGSYVRLQNVSLSYDLKIEKMSGVKIYVRGENLFVITKYKGLDPDAPSFGSLPPSKIFVGGIQFTL